MESANLPALRPADPAVRRRLWLLFGLGIASIVPVMLASALTLPFAGSFASPRAQLAVLAFIGSSLPEEAMRFAVLWLVGWRWGGLARPRDGIVFGLLVALGFSCAENLFYGLSIGWATGILKLAVATPMHLALGVTMGALLAVARRDPAQRTLWIAGAFAAPLLMHGMYDFSLLQALADVDAETVGRLLPPIAIYLLVGVIAVLTALRARQPAQAA